MYRALYRKWRPQVFSDVIGQQATVTALKNQIATNRIGHAYMFTGVRGTGKTTCAKIFAKAINCQNPLPNGDPCGECPICRGIDNGSNLDVIEMDAASNNGVDDIRTLKDETAYTPSSCRYKVYIIDEVHMLSAGAFNALLKTLEEPPSHIVFILATTEIHKVPVTILSRCQRYDFKRIDANQIASRLNEVAANENIAITAEAVQLISRLADGAMRDALSILDTCAGSEGQIDEQKVRDMTGTIDKSYLFRISTGIAKADHAAVLHELALFRQLSDDMKRFCEELISHYRNLMIASIPGGQGLLSGVSPHDEAQYLQNQDVSQKDAVRAIQILGKALEHLSRGGDPRVELEIALFDLCTPEITVPLASSSALADRSPQSVEQPRDIPSLPNKPFVSGWSPSSAAPVISENAPSLPIATVFSPPEQTLPILSVPSSNVSEPVIPTGLFDSWTQVLAVFEKESIMLFNYLKDSKAFYDGKRVLIDGGNVFRDYIRTDKEAQNYIKEVIFKVCGKHIPIGPYSAPHQGEAGHKNIEDELSRLQNLGADIVIQDK